MRRRLKLHPDSPGLAALRIDVDVERRAGTLELHYAVRGDIEALLFPAPAPSDRTDKLWQHTCFEAFIGGVPGYFELNFSPSGQWAAYRFDDYRKGMREAEIALPRIETSREPGCFELRAQIELPVGGAGPLGLSAVIEEKSGAKSYWALAHPPGPPDFHHEACFALELPAAKGP